MKTLLRILAYLWNDPKRAEGLDAPAPGPVPKWILQAAGDDDLAEQAVAIALKSQELAESGVSSLQDKAASHLTLLLALVPIALGVSTLGIPAPGSTDIGRWGAFILLVAADVALLVSIILATLAAGLRLGGGIGLDGLGELADEIAPKAPMKSAIQAAEAEALRYAAALAYASGSRVAADLYASRRFLVLAAMAASIGLMVLVGSAGGLGVFRAAITSPHP